MAVRSLGESEAITDTPRRELRVLSDHELLNLTWFRYAGGERGADPHIHEHHTDAFYVLSGEVTLGLGPELEEVVASGRERSSSSPRASCTASGTPARPRPAS